MATDRSRWTDERLDALEERVMRQDIVEARFDGLEARFDGLEHRFNGLEAGFEGLEHRFDRFETRLDRLEGAVTATVNGLRGELYETRRWMLTLWLTGLLAILAVLVEIAVTH
jgi:uncharacterized coiled-coil protein SlyX